MKLLLTSAGIKNASIHSALDDLLDTPIAESRALCIPTASYAIPNGRPGKRVQASAALRHRVKVGGSANSR